MERKILVVSDATGSTAEHVLRAALAQFDADDVLIERRPQVRTVQEVCGVVEEAHRTGAMLVHTLAAVDLRREIYLRATERRIQSVDLLGNVLSDLSSFSGPAPAGVPAGAHRFDDNYHRRMDALTFVVKHDDGMGLEDLDRAEIIIVGVSRTSKTPLSIYLAVRGCFVDNIPIVLTVERPRELFKAARRQVVGRRMDPAPLRHV